MKLITPRTAATMLAVGPDTIYRMIKDGRLYAIRRLRGRSLRIREADVLALAQVPHSQAGS